MCCKGDNSVIWQVYCEHWKWTVSHLTADELLALCMRIQPAKVKGLFEALKTYFVIHWFCDGVFDKLWGVPWGVQRWGPASNGEKFAFIVFDVISSASTNVWKSKFFFIVLHLRWFARTVTHSARLALVSWQSVPSAGRHKFYLSNTLIEKIYIFV